jgi:hypothetical protein
MDFNVLQMLIEMLRGKKTAADPLQSDQGPTAMSGGLSAMADPAYAAHVREAKSMGEAPMSPEQFRAKGR